MSTDTTNWLWGPIERLRSLLAAGTAFQAWVGAEGDAETAAASIYVPAVVESLADARPFAFIDQGDERSTTRISTDDFSDRGALFLFFEADVPVAYTGEQTNATVEAAHKHFLSEVADVLGELLNDSHEAATLAITGIRLVHGPARTDPADRQTDGDYYQAGFEIEWEGVAG